MDALETFDFGGISAVLIDVQLMREFGDRALDLIPPHVKKVLFWREATYGQLDSKLQERFDILMGTHFTDSILNPCHLDSNFNVPFSNTDFANQTRFAGKNNIYYDATHRSLCTG